MNTAMWLAVAIPTLLGVAPITQGRGHRINEKELGKYVRSRGLPLPVELRAPVLDRIGRRERSALWWGAGALAIGVIAALIIDRVTGRDGLGAPLVMLLPAFGSGLGAYLGVRRTRPRLIPDAPRVARAQATEVTDYTTRSEELAVRLAPLTVLVALAAAVAVWWLVPVKPAGGVWVPVLLALATAVVLGLWVVARRAERGLIEQPQFAHSDLELAWDDATRVDAIRALRDNSVAVAMLAVLGLLVTAGMWVVPDAVRAQGMDLTMYLGIAAFAVGLICWIVLLVPWLDGRTRRNPALGLWSGKFGVA